MSDNKEQLLKIIQKYLAGKATDTEKDFLESYFEFFRHEENVLDKLIDEEKKLLKEKMQSNIMANIQSETANTELIDLESNDKTHTFWSPLLKYSAAAAILICCITGAFLLHHPKPQPQLAVAKHDIMPGTNKAILTLSNGQKINLNDAKSGELAKQSGVSITKAGNGQLVYTILSQSVQNLNQNVRSLVPSTNKIETQNGGQYQIILPDGTHVWLNAASSLTYPTSFAANERKVSMTGEGYFEVSKDAKRPFKVEVNGQTEVRVLGTHFNINAYNEEKNISTTLMEGSVILTTNHRSAMLVPGQQGQVNKAGDKISLVNDVDLDQVIAWKNGYFSYNTASLDMIMKQVQRWYDIKVVYVDDVHTEFVAKLPRDLPLSELLKLLELTKGVHFKLEGKTLEITK